MFLVLPRSALHCLYDCVCERERAFECVCGRGVRKESRTTPTRKVLMGDWKAKGNLVSSSPLTSLGGSSSSGCIPAMEPAPTRHTHQNFHLSGAGSFSVSHHPLVPRVVTASCWCQSQGCHSVPWLASQLLCNLCHQLPRLNSLCLKHPEWFWVHLDPGIQRAFPWSGPGARVSVEVKVDTVSVPMALLGKFTRRWPVQNSLSLSLENAF